MSDVSGAGLAASGIAQAAATVSAAALQSAATENAAHIQTTSADRSANLVNDRYNQSRDDFTPYRQVGSNAAGALADNLGALSSTAQTPYGAALAGAVPTMPGEMTQANLEATPGYQFTLSQGLKSTQNAAAARGLGVSGAALKGAGAYATGLSDQTYNTRFNQQQALFGNQQTLFGDAQTQYTNDQGQRSNAYNRLLGVTTLGQNSAAQTGALGNTAANQAGGYLTGGANAAGASLIAGGNALAGGANGLANAYTNYGAQSRLYDQSGGIYGNQSIKYGDGYNGTALNTGMGS